MVQPKDAKKCVDAICIPKMRINFNASPSSWANKNAIKTAYEDD